MVRSIHLGMGEVGEQRLKLYKEHAAKRGKSLSALIVELVDKDLGIFLPKPKTSKGRRPSRRK